MTPASYDLIVIGGGTAGLTAAQVAASLGARTLLVEKDRPGGECLYTGCVPSKTLLAVAREVRDARRAARLGLTVEGEADWAAVRARLRRAVAEIEPHDSPDALARAKVEFRRGAARFVGPRLLEIEGPGGEREVRTARAFVLATGASPAVPDLPGLRDAGFLTTDTVFDLPARPARLAVLGGGPVGAELAQAFARLGSRVVLVEAGSRLLGGEEPEAARAAHAALHADGVEVRLSARPVEVRATPDGPELRFASGPPVGATHLLVATGKRPNVRGLGLETVGARFDDAGGLWVDANLRSTCPYLWGAGDVVGPPRFTHLAFERGVVAALASLGGAFAAVARLRAPVLRPEATPRVTFLDPEIAAWGLTEAEARDRFGRRIEVVDYDLAKLDRAIADGAAEAGGFVKLVARSGAFGSPLGARLLGACVVGPRAGEVAQILALTARAGVDPLRLALAPAAYPTYGEAARWAVAGLYSESDVFGKRRRGGLA